MKTIQLNGLLWDAKNLKGYFTFDEAQDAAKEAGKRLPTKEEFEALCELPNCWDKLLKGCWFAETARDLGDPDKSVFFPASGCRYFGSGAFNWIGTNGFNWSSTPEPNSGNGYFFQLTNVAVYPTKTNGYRTYGYPVRCVSDVL